MQRTLSGHPGFSRRVCALLLSSATLFGMMLIGLKPASATVVDDGRVKLPIIYDTTVSTLPDTAGGQELTPAGTVTHNLGSFDIVINPSVALAANAPALAAFNRAALLWESRIADPITVTIDADFTALGPGILGSTSTVLLQGGYNLIRNQMVADAADESDDGIVASLPTFAQFSAIVPAGFALDGNIATSKANLKAMGFTGLDGSFGVSDGDITFSTLFGFDFDNSNGITLGQYDFEGVAAHEIGHLLGFFSVVDDIDFILPGTTSEIKPTPLDLFRFRPGAGNNPATAAEFTTFPRSLTPGQPEFFDQINAGLGGSVEVLFSTGVTNGDGRQASHWKDSFGLGIMDPTAAPGELLILRPNDLRAMDLIAYDIIQVPEASTLSLLLMGSAGTIGWRRRNAGR
jgi:hypothetical protein